MKVAPSILASDFSRLGEEIKKVTEAGADYIHVDVMDGMFVKNITLGPIIIKSIRKYTKVPFDVHLMIINPLRYIKDFVQAGADIITIHIEAEKNILETIKLIKSNGLKAGLAIKPNTPTDEILKYLELLDLVLVMTVEPGFGGQLFIDNMMEKVKVLDKEIKKRKLKTLIEVDGGINEKTARIASQAGANICVAGTSVYKSKNIREAIENLRNS